MAIASTTTVRSGMDRIVRPSPARNRNGRPTVSYGNDTNRLRKFLADGVSSRGPNVSLRQTSLPLITPTRTDPFNTGPPESPEQPTPLPVEGSGMPVSTRTLGGTSRLAVTDAIRRMKSAPNPGSPGRGAA